MCNNALEFSCNVFCNDYIYADDCKYRCTNNMKFPRWKVIIHKKVKTQLISEIKNRSYWNRNVCTIKAYKLLEQRLVSFSLQTLKEINNKWETIYIYIYYGYRKCTFLTSIVSIYIVISMFNETIIPNITKYLIQSADKVAVACVEYSVSVAQSGEWQLETNGILLKYHTVYWTGFV